MTEEFSGLDETNPSSADFDKLKSDFLDFLNGSRPPLFVAGSLSALLRTDGESPVEDRVRAEMIRGWAEQQAVGTARPASDYLIEAFRRILEAHTSNSIHGFDPITFFQTVGLELGTRCSHQELESYRSGVHALLDRLPKQPDAARRDDSDHTSFVEVDGKRLPVDAAQEELLTKLETTAYMADSEFDRVMLSLEAAFTSRVGIPIVSALRRLTRAGADVFNTGRVDQASRIFTFVVSAMERLNVAANDRAEIGAEIGKGRINESKLAQLLDDPDKRSLVAPIVLVLDYLQPKAAFQELSDEPRRDRRRLLLNALEVHGSPAFEAAMALLRSPASANEPWFTTRNKLYILSRTDAPDNDLRRQAIEAVGRYVTHDQPQVSIAALAALKRAGGREIVPYVVRALDHTAYVPGSIDDTESLKRQLHQALEILVDAGTDATLAIVAEVAVGARATEFDLGAELRNDACHVLATKKGRLPRRAALVISEHLSGLLNKKFKLVTGKLTLGLDVATCRLLSSLIRDTDEEEVRQVLEHPILQRLQAVDTA